MIKNKLSLESSNHIVDKISLIRMNALKHRKKYGIEQLKYPISFWIKEERLREGLGKEFTIILRTSGCSWASKEIGGCSMCGYYLDAFQGNVSTSQIINQFDFAYNKKINDIKKDDYDYVLKIFNSGSFLDEIEISKEARYNILEKISEEKKIKEVVLESRMEFINSEKIKEIKELLSTKYIEIAIGLETANDYIRNNYINKGVQFQDFENTLKICKQQGVGVKVYLLFKPPFLNEQAAIDDCANSIKKLIKLGINSISINPMNIQKGTLVEYLWYQNRYRLPWFYSLFKSIKKAVKQEDLKSTRLLSDPSGAGTKRGIHNCLKKECENNSKKILKNFVLTQNLNELEKKEYECDCKKRYQFKKDYY
ncbi:MAG: archaeosine biosynthesis radical SAM protein RaSEA [Candidatus Thorarchaeota archaeon]